MIHSAQAAYQSIHCKHETPAGTTSLSFPVNRKGDHHHAFVDASSLASFVNDHFQLKVQH